MTRRHTVLVVDDEPDVVQSVQDLLRLTYRVVGAHSAKDALKVLREHEVHIVMTDQRMPEMSGVQFLRQVRGEHPDAIRLLFTGYADIKAVIDAINQGNVYRYITKPWDPDELLTVLRQAADQYDLIVERKHLLRELQVKNEELERANAELRQANELKEAFIKVASHELRTPLTILLGLTELALPTPGLSPTLRGWLTHVHKASQRLNRLVNQLIQMLQAGCFERPLERAETDLALLLHDAVAEIRPFVEQRRQELTLDLAPDLGSLAVEANKIHDSLENLLLNAIKFTPDGGKIRVTARRGADGEAVISVSDSGPGIAPAHRQHLFKAFFTELNVSRHTSGLYEFGRRGLGLGLSLVKAFVELHGGRVEVASEPLQGATFTIRLPPAPGRDARPEPDGKEG
jgi:signal transduction histidine kinase